VKDVDMKISLAVRTFLFLTLLLVLLSVPKAQSSADDSFAQRCAASGVVQCIGFENLISAIPQCNGNWPSVGGQCYQPPSGGNHAYADQSVYASGDGNGKHAALRLDATNVAGANISGDYFIGWPRSFGSNSHFYVQYRMRLKGFASSSAPWTSPNIGGQGWKTTVFAPINGPLCGPTELATVNFYYENKLRLYTNCSSTAYDNFEFNLVQQQGDFTCRYQDPNPQANCAMFHGEQWMTFYYDVQIGTMGTQSSTVRAYIDYGDGRGYRQWTSASNYRLGGSGNFGLTDFTNYTTGKSSSAPSPNTYSMWIDEFILSTSPIASPSGSPGGSSSAPSAPTNLRIVTS
jgi:hypothetical protein